MSKRTHPTPTEKTKMTTNTPSTFQQRLSDLTVLAALLVAVAGGIWPLWTPGWPFNHELLYFAQRTGVYADHWRQGEWLPLWSAADNLGFGSPQPALYHKLFYLVAGPAYGWNHEMKGALLLATAFFLLVGGGGMLFLLRTLGAGRWSGLAGGILLIFANYTSTNWLVRGALAEFSGAMLVPWGMAFFLRLLRRESRSKDAVAFGLCLSLIFLAHSVLAYFLVLLLPILAAALWRPWGVRAERGLLLRLALAACLSLLTLAPILLAMGQLSQGYDLSRILPPKYLPANQVQPLLRYFWDNYLFGRDFREYTVQLDVWPLAVAVVGGGWLLWRRQRAAEVWSLLLLVAVILFLQSRAGVWVYASLPGGNYIQFPWRLLAIATPALLAAALLILRRLALAAGWGEGGAAASALLLAALSLFHSGPLMKLDYGRYSPQQLANWAANPVVFSLFGEYLPKTVPLDNPLLGNNPALWAQAQGCRLQEENGAATFDALQRRFVAECANPALLALPLFGSPFHRLAVNGQPATCQLLPALPGLCALSVPAGRSTLEVRMPSWGSLWRRTAKGVAGRP